MEATPNASPKELLVSIVVNNYNYAHFLAQAVESALRQTYPCVETIVVDDGSTDNSREVLEAFGDRIRTVFKENGGQGSAFNAGFKASQGDIVIYLDADDYLYPSAVEKVVRRWNGNVAKIHYRLLTVDADGVEHGLHPRQGVPLPEGEVWRDYIRTGTYATPATTGNAFARSALEQVLPMPEEGYVYSADAYLLVRIPFHGLILAVDEALGVYRQHRKNYSVSSGLSADLAANRRRMQREACNDAAFKTELQRVAPGTDPEVRYLPYQRLKLRTLSWKLDRDEHPLPADHWPLLARLAVRAVWRGDKMSLAERLLQSAWFLGVLGLPRAAVLAVFRRGHTVKSLVKPGSAERLRPEL